MLADIDPSREIALVCDDIGTLLDDALDSMNRASAAYDGAERLRGGTGSSEHLSGRHLHAAQATGLAQTAEAEAAELEAYGRRRFE